MKQALIVVDFQRDFVSGSLGFPAAQALEAAICRRIAECRQAGGDILFTLDTHGEDYLSTQEGKRLPIVHCVRGTAGHGLTDQVSALAAPEDRVFEKPGFGSPALYEYLKGRDYDRIELCGVVTSICVISNAILAKTALPEAELVVNAALTAGPDRSLTEKALDVMENLQITILR